MRANLPILLLGLAGTAATVGSETPQRDLSPDFVLPQAVLPDLGRRAPGLASEAMRACESGRRTQVLRMFKGREDASLLQLLEAVDNAASDDPARQRAGAALLEYSLQAAAGPSGTKTDFRRFDEPGRPAIAEPLATNAGVVDARFPGFGLPCPVAAMDQGTGVQVELAAMQVLGRPVRGKAEIAKPSEAEARDLFLRMAHKMAAVRTPDRTRASTLHERGAQRESNRWTWERAGAPRLELLLQLDGGAWSVVLDGIAP